MPDEHQKDTHALDDIALGFAHRIRKTSSILLAQRDARKNQHKNRKVEKNHGMLPKSNEDLDSWVAVLCCKAQVTRKVDRYASET